MTVDEPNTQGWALTRLIQLHEGMRNDLALLGRIGDAVGDGDDAAATAVLERLAIRQPAWTLRTFCAAFCGFVHEHHSTEDAVMFPMLLEHADGDLPMVIAQLKEDHRAISRYLDSAEQAIAALPAERSAAQRAVQDLSTHLAAHLDFEEQQLAPALNAVSLVISEDDVPAPPPDVVGGISGHRP